MKHLFFKTTLFLFIVTNVFAHPHTFIEVEPTLEVNAKTSNKLHVKWKLDEMTSMMLIMELDINSNGKFEKDENDFIYANYFNSLKKYNYYMSINANDKSMRIEPKNFKASIENNKLIYAFDLEHKENIQNLKIAFFDTELFVGMILEKEFITLKGVNQENVNHLKKTIFGVN